MTALNILIIGTVFIFIGVSIFIFFKRYKENKAKLDRLNRDSAHELKQSFEEELLKKKEDELKRLNQGDKNVILEVLHRLFKSSKLAGWIKSYQFHLYNTRSISVIAHISEKENVVQTEKEIILKTGETYKQKKHHLTVKKEYAEKILMAVYKIIDEIFQAIPTMNKIYLSEYINEGEDAPFCVLSLEVSRDQYNTVKNYRNPDIHKTLEYFKAKFEFDPKSYDFKEIEPVATPTGEASLEKTMSTKATSGTVLYGNTILSANEQPVSTRTEDKGLPPSGVDSNTRISDLNGSVMFDKTLLFKNEKQEAQNNGPAYEGVADSTSAENNDFDVVLGKFIAKSELKVQKEINFNQHEKLILALRPSLIEDKYLIFVSGSDNTVKEEELKNFYSRMKDEKIDKGIYVSNGAFALDAMSFAAQSNILLFDKEKLIKATV